AEEDVRGAGSRLQAALGELALGVAHLELAGRQLEAEIQPDDVAYGVGALARLQLVAADEAQVARLGEVPRLGQPRPVVVVDVLMAPIDHRHRGAQAPMRVEGVIERNDNVAIESRHFVMVATQLAYAHLVAPRARLI